MSVNKKLISNADAVKAAFDTLSEVESLRKKWISFDVWSKLIIDYNKVNKLCSANLNVQVVDIMKTTAASFHEV